MKNIFSFCRSRFLSAILVSVFILGLVGCGPKGASQEQLTKLAELKVSCETMEAQLKDLENERTKLEQEKLEKQQTKSRLQAEYEILEKESLSAVGGSASGGKEDE